MPDKKFNGYNDSYRPGKKVSTPTTSGVLHKPVSIGAAKKVPSHTRKDK